MRGAAVTATWLVLCVVLFPDLPCQWRLYDLDPVPGNVCVQKAAQLMRGDPAIRRWNCSVTRPDLPLVPRRINADRFA